MTQKLISYPYGCLSKPCFPVSYFKHIFLTDNTFKQLRSQKYKKHIQKILTVTSSTLFPPPSLDYHSYVSFYLYKFTDFLQRTSLFISQLVMFFFSFSVMGPFILVAVVIIFFSAFFPFVLLGFFPSFLSLSLN